MDMGDAQKIVDAAVGRIVSAAFDAIQADPHQWSNRPCETCRAVTNITGYPLRVPPIPVRAKERYGVRREGGAMSLDIYEELWFEECAYCGGTGWVEFDSEPCPVCDCKGFVRKERAQ